MKKKQPQPRAFPSELAKADEVNQTLAEWRKTNFAETQKCLDVAKSIRDDTGASNKDRIEAVKSIARLLGSLAPERIAAPKGSSGDENKALSQEETSLLDGLLHDINPT
jgi:hypothetical protein